MKIVLYLIILHSVVRCLSPNINIAQQHSYVTKGCISFIPNNNRSSECSVIFWLRNNNKLLVNSQRGRYHVLINLLLSGQVEINPGPLRTPKFPCGDCGKSARLGRSIACDCCNTWFHPDWISMNSIVYDRLVNSSMSWECLKCGLPNTSTTLFDTNISDYSNLSDSSNISLNIPKRKASQLRMLVTNFQSIWEKKELLEIELKSSNVDIVIGSETHLDSCINDSEVIPGNYVCYRRDRSDAYGGVILIVKKELIAEKVLSSNNSELIAIKVQCHGKPLIVAACYRRPSRDLSEAKGI